MQAVTNSSRIFGVFLAVVSQHQSYRFGNIAGILWPCIVLWLSLLLLAGCEGSNSSSASLNSIQGANVLVFTKTAGFRHASIPAGIAAIMSLGDEHQFHVDASEDAVVFTDDNLARYQVVIFFNTTGDILDPAQEAAFARFIQNGGGFVGIHSASDTEHDWVWYGQLVGTFFDSHPAIQTATTNVVDATHDSTRLLPETWIRTDEWYNFRSDPSPAVSVLITLDETTYDGGTLGDSHPISWYHEFDGGRAWYTAMGHTSESYSEPLFLSHLLGGILWAAGVTTP